MMARAPEHAARECPSTPSQAEMESAERVVIGRFTQV